MESGPDVGSPRGRHGLYTTSAGGEPCGCSAGCLAGSKGAEATSVTRPGGELPLCPDGRAADFGTQVQKLVGRHPDRDVHPERIRRRTEEHQVERRGCGRLLELPVCPQLSGSMRWDRPIEQREYRVCVALAVRPIARGQRIRRLRMTGRGVRHGPRPRGPTTRRFGPFAARQVHPPMMRAAWPSLVVGAARSIVRIDAVYRRRIRATTSRGRLPHPEFLLVAIRWAG